MRSAETTDGLLTIIMDDPKMALSPIFWEAAEKGRKLLWLPKSDQAFSGADADLLTKIGQRTLHSQNGFKDEAHLSAEEIETNDQQVHELNAEIECIKAANEGFPRGEMIQKILAGRIELALLLNVPAVLIAIEQQIKGLARFVHSKGGSVSAYVGKQVAGGAAALMLESDPKEAFVMPDSRVTFDHLKNNHELKKALLSRIAREKRAQMESFFTRAATEPGDALKTGLALKGQEAENWGLARVARIEESLQETASLRTRFMINHGVNAEALATRRSLVAFFEKSAPDTSSPRYDPVNGLFEQQTGGFDILKDVNDSDN